MSDQQNQQLAPLPLLTIDTVLQSGTLIFHALQVYLRSIQICVAYVERMMQWIPFLRTPILYSLDLLKWGMSFGFGFLAGVLDELISRGF